VELDGEDVLLRPGDVLLIPSNAPHLLEALEDSEGTDVFIPPREDLLPAYCWMIEPHEPALPKRRAT